MLRERNRDVTGIGRGTLLLYPYNLLRHVVVLSFKKMSSKCEPLLKNQSAVTFSMKSLHAPSIRKEITPSSPTRALISILLTIFKHFTLHVSFGYEPALRFAEVVSHCEHKYPFDRTGPRHVSKTHHIIQTSWVPSPFNFQRCKVFIHPSLIAGIDQWFEIS
jgi:hypothetical protein